MLSGLWSLELLAEEIELVTRQNDLAHVETDSELGHRDEATSELIEVSEELRDSDSLLLANLSKLGDDILNILWLILLDINTRNSWPSLWIVVEGVIVVSANAEELLGRVDIVAEVKIVHLINISLIHVHLEQNVQDLLTS